MFSFVFRAVVPKLETLHFCNRAAKFFTKKTVSTENMINQEKFGNTQLIILFPYTKYSKVETRIFNWNFYDDDEFQRNHVKTLACKR